MQRFGGALNLNVHFHLIALDGVLEETEGDGSPLRFRALPPPTRDDLDRMVRAVHRRATRWLRRKGHVDDDEGVASDRADESDALLAFASAAMTPGTLATIDSRGAAGGGDEADADLDRRERRFSARYEGFDLHAAVCVAEGDDASRERLVRYGARPCFALDRLSELPDGRLAYRVKYSRRGKRHRIMTSLELLARIAALIPPPRYPLTRFHGVLAPHSKWRARVVPVTPKPARVCKHIEPDSPTAADTSGLGPTTDASPTAAAARPTRDRSHAQRGDGEREGTFARVAEPRSRRDALARERDERSSVAGRTSRHRANHDPCVPAPAGPYFNTVPELPDTVSVGFAFADTKGVRIPVGGERTIWLQLFSDVPLDAWTIQAKDNSGEPAHLSFVLDKSSGKNGDRIALIIHKNSESKTLGAEPFAIYSSNGKHRHASYGVVGH